MPKSDYIEPTGHSLAFTLHISGENYSYVITEGIERNIPRNRVINEIIAEHRAAAAKRNGRAKK
jgi:hypothetical protein